MSEERNEKSIQYGKVYHELLLDPMITDSAAIIYGILVSSCHRDTMTYVSNKKIASHSGKSQTAIKNAIKLLEANNYIVVTGSHNSRLIYPKHLTLDLSNVVQTPNNRIFNEKQHKYMDACVTNWGERVKVGEFERVAGAQHKLKPLGVGQSKTVWRIYQYLQDASKGNVEFYDKYVDKLTASWLEKTGISRDKVEKSNKTLKEALKIHLDLLKQGIEKEGFRKIPNSLEHFFVQTQKTPENQSIVSSWFLYWVCKDEIVKENITKQKENIQPLKRKYPDSNTQYYKAVGAIFKVNIKKLEKTPTELNNQVILLAEAVIDEIKEKNKTLPKKAKLSTATLSTDLEAFLKVAGEYMHNFNPTQFMPGRRSWNGFIDYLADKQDPCYKATFKPLYHTIIESEFNSGA